MWIDMCDTFKRQSTMDLLSKLEELDVIDDWHVDGHRLRVRQGRESFCVELVYADPFLRSLLRFAEILPGRKEDGVSQVSSALDRLASQREPRAI